MSPMGVNETFYLLLLTLDILDNSHSCHDLHWMRDRELHWMLCTNGTREKS